MTQDVLQHYPSPDPAPAVQPPDPDATQFIDPGAVGRHRADGTLSRKTTPRGGWRGWAIVPRRLRRPAAGGDA